MVTVAPVVAPVLVEPLAAVVEAEPAVTLLTMLSAVPSDQLKRVAESPALQNVESELPHHQVPASLLTLQANSFVHEPES